MMYETKRLGFFSLEKRGVKGNLIIDFKDLKGDYIRRLEISISYLNGGLQTIYSSAGSRALS